MLNQQLLINDLQLNIKGDVLHDAVSLGLYATDASVYQINPVAVVAPKDEADVLKALEIAKDYQLSILPRGGGTSLAGQTVGNSLILDFSKYMNQILEFHEAEQWARVQPGLVRDELNHFLKTYHLHFAPDPATSSRANIGGMIGNNSSGTKSIIYGKTVDHVLELKIALHDGTILHLKEESPKSFDSIAAQNDREGEIYSGVYEIVKANEAAIIERFPKVMRRVQGYNLDELAGKSNWNLSKLITGSEGTLAIILEAKINLEPLPKYKSVCVAHFAVLNKAIEAVNHMLPFQPSAIEILDKTVLDLSRENLTTRRSCHFLEGDPVAIQIVEFYGDTQEDVLDRPKAMITKLKELGLGYAFPLFPEGEAYDDVWLIRKKGLGLMLGIKGNKKPLPFIEDAGIPTDVLPEYIQKVLAICKKHETDAAMYAHASVGVIHVRPILDLRLAEDIERFKHIADETFQLVKSYGGSWSGEHGDGLVRSFYLPEYFGEQVYGALKAVKQLFDPEHRMNPDKIIDSPPIDQNLRYGADYQDNIRESYFHFRVDGSFENAVHMCTGVGECRKMLGGTMCPSFKATRDEEQSTRGRANVLRLAMSGQLNGKGLTEDRVLESLDLCLSCKACKSECPSNVDMAKLKSEVLQQKYDEKGAGLREVFIKNSSRLAAIFSGRLAPLINYVQSTSLFRGLLEQFVNIHRKRILPAYTSQSFASWFRKNYQKPKTINKQVVLFADTYLNYHEPNIGVATSELLTKLGYEVILADVGCCQRPLISNGFLREAKKNGTKTAMALKPYIDQGLKIVVCEPSCASALNDDLPDLIDDEVLAKQLKNHVQMIDVFLAEELDQDGLQLNFKTGINKDIYIHGHCHQKALYGTKAMIDVLKNSGQTVQEIPSGCCGMAGSFGYEKEHYDISQKIGAPILFNTLNELPESTRVLACGFSCRHQIEDFTAHKPMHWVECLNELIE
jgi:FAD/FMN-containing dehydrogenase/Fe-S oxidoreductase